VGATWFSWRAIRLHLTAIIVVPGCLVAGWWQVHRALSGNALSWAYSVEWPVFAGYGVYLWWKLVHERPAEPANETVAADGDLPAPDGRLADVEAVEHENLQREDLASEDDELAAYNRYLAELSAADKPKRW
jgi:DNA-binding transcriptional regulator of glucitol operon